MKYTEEQLKEYLVKGSIISWKNAVVIVKKFVSINEIHVTDPIGVVDWSEVPPWKWIMDNCECEIVKSKALEPKPIVIYLCREVKFAVGKEKAKESYKFINCTQSDVENFALQVLNISNSKYFLSSELKEDYPVQYIVKPKFVENKTNYRINYLITFNHKKWNEK